MANEYDTFLQPDQQTNDLNEYDEIVGDAADQITTDRRTSLVAAVRRNPDEFANVVELSKNTGLPTDMVERNQSRIEAEAQAAEFDLELADSPTLAKKFTDPDFSSMAYDDLVTLVDAEKNIRQPLTYSEDLGKRYAKGEAVVSSSQIGVSRMNSILGFGPKIDEADAIQRLAALEPAMGFTGKERGYVGEIPFITAEQLPIQAFILGTGLDTGIKYGTLGAAGALMFGQAGPQVLLPEEVLTVPGAALAMGAVGMKIGSFQGAYELEGGLAFNEYAAMRDENGVPLDPQLAATAAVVTGLINGALEYASLRVLGNTFTPMKILTRQRIRAAMRTEAGRAAIKGIAARYFAVVAGEGVQEAGQEFTTIGMGEISKAIDDESFTDVTFSKALDNIFSAKTGERVLEAGKAGTQAGFAFGLPGTVSSSVQAATRSENTTQLEQQRIEKLVEISKDSKLASRSPETFMQMVREVEEESGAIADIYITADEADSWLRTEGIDIGDTENHNPAVSTIVAQLEQALETQTDIVVPIEEFMAYIPNSESFDSLRAHVKLSQNAWTQAEAGEARDTYNSRLKGLMAKANEDGDTYRRSQAIYESIEKQLVATGQVTPESAKWSAQLIPAYAAARANSMQMPVEEIYSMMGVGVAGEGGPTIVGPNAAFPGDGESIANQLSPEEFKVQELNKDISLDSNDEGFSIQVPAASEDELKRTHIAVAKRGDTFQIFDASVIDELRGQGVGQQLIMMAAEEATQRGGTLISDTLVSVSQLRVYEALKRKGWEIEYEEPAVVANALETKEAEFSVTTQNTQPVVKSIKPPLETAAQRDEPGTVRGRINFAAETRAAIIQMMEASDLSTFLHESGHLFLEMERRIADHPDATEQMKSDQDSILAWLGADSWDQVRVGTEYHEKWASAFEQYLEEGKAPSIELREAFRRFSAWLRQVYRKWQGSKNFYQKQGLNVNLTPEIRAVMDRMLATEDQIAAAESNLHYDQLFNSADEAGMTVEQFKEYASDQSKPTASAQEKLTAKILRQLTRRTKKWWKEELASVSAEIESDLAGTPLYQAIAFMRAKKPADGFAENKMNRQAVYEIIGIAEPKDEKPYTVLEAIANLGGLDREEAEAQGVDPAFWRGRGSDNTQFFGKPIFRKTGGRSFDDMREALQQEGWLAADREDRPSESSIDDLLEVLMPALAGEEVLHPSQAYFELDSDYEREYNRRRGGPDDLTVEDEPIKRRRQPRQFLGLTKANGGANPDSIAAIFRFASGIDLVRAIESNPTLKEAVATAAERTMVERHGDILTDGTLEREAQEAAHNQDRGKAILAELKILNDKASVQAVADRKATREAAAAIIAAKRLSALRPDLYRRAEIKSAQEAARAKDAGDLDAAAKAKQQQYMNYHLWREATKAKEKAESISKQLEKMRNKAYTAREANPEHVRRFKTLLSVYSFKRTNREARAHAREQLESVKAWVEQNQVDPETLATMTESVMLSRLVHYKDMTLDELIAVRDVAFSIRHAGRAASTIKKEAFNAEMDVISQNIDSKTKPKKKLPAEKTPWGTASEWGRSSLAAHRKLESLIRQADGFQDQGPLWKKVIKPLLEASNAQLSLQEEAHDKLSEIFNGHTAALSSMRKRQTFTLESGEELTLSLGARMTVALNMGNADNHKAMLSQNNLAMTEADLEMIVGTLSESDLDAIEDIWKFIKGYWPKIKELEERMTGVAPPAVTATPFTLASGRVMSGGYYPIIGDARLSWIQSEQDVITRAERVKNGNTGRSTTAHGHTIARVGWNGKAVNLSIEGLFRHIDMVVHDLTHREAVREVDRVLAQHHVKDSLTKALGREAVSSMRQRIAEVAAGHTHPSELSAFERMFRYARLALTYGALGFSLKTGFTQTLGLGVAIGEFGAETITKGMMDFYSNPIANAKFIREKSIYMRDRVSTMNRDTDAVLRHLKGKGPWNKLKEKSFMFLLAGDLAISRPVWWAAYNQGLERVGSAAADDAGFSTEQDAINWADRAVARTQQSGMMMDLAGVESKNEFVKAWTVMYSAFSAIYNITTEQTRKMDIGKINKVEYAYNLMWIILIPALLEELVSGYDDQDPDDETWFWNRWTKAVAGYSLGTMFLLREVAWTMRSGQASKLPVQRLLESPFNVAKQLEQGELDTAAIRAITTALSLAHVPGGSQMNRTANYFIELNEGTEEGFNPWEAFVIGPRENEE